MDVLFRVNGRCYYISSPRISVSPVLPFPDVSQSPCLSSPFPRFSDSPVLRFSTIDLDKSQKHITIYIRKSRILSSMHREAYMQKFVMCIIICLITSSVRADRITADSHHQVECDSIEPQRTVSPGTAVGLTDYDCQADGSMGRTIVATASLGSHYLWTYREYADTTRRVYYNFFLPPSYWLNPMGVPVFLEPSLAGRGSDFVDGRGVIAANLRVSNSLVPVLIVDPLGAISPVFIPIQNPLDPILWPVPCVDANDNIFISGTSNAGLHIIRSTDEGSTWSAWVLVDATGDHESWATFSGKTAVVYNAGTDFENVYYWETTDNGVTWTADTICIPTPQDSVVGYIWNSAVYDNNGYLHVVFNCIDPSPAGQGGQNYSGYRSQIRHWNQENGLISIVASGWWTLDPGPGSLHPTVSESQLAINRLSGTLYCTWCQADSGDVAASGYTNLEIYGAHSTDNGATWSVPVNITNSRTPGAYAGYCEHDSWQSLAETTRDDTLYLFYMNDKDAGCVEFLEGTRTENNMLFYRCYFPVGVEETTISKPLNLMLRIKSNPVSHRTVINYTLPAPGDYSLCLFDICGRLLSILEEGSKPSGNYTEVLDLARLPNGTYFVVLQADDAASSAPFTIIK
jgi:hypothetical protein